MPNIEYRIHGIGSICKTSGIGPPPLPLYSPLLQTFEMSPRSFYQCLLPLLTKVMAREKNKKCGVVEKSPQTGTKFLSPKKWLHAFCWVSKGLASLSKITNLEDSNVSSAFVFVRILSLIKQLNFFESKCFLKKLFFVCFHKKTHPMKDEVLWDRFSSTVTEIKSWQACSRLAQHYKQGVTLQFNAVGCSSIGENFYICPEILTMLWMCMLGRKVLSSTVLAKMSLNLQTFGRTVIFVSTSTSLQNKTECTHKLYKKQDKRINNFTNISVQWADAFSSDISYVHFR